MNLEDREHLITLFEQYQNLLTQTQKQAFHLHYIEDLSLAEASKVLATTRQAVSDAINKAKKKLLLIENSIK